MELMRKTVEYRGETFTVMELTIGGLMPLLEGLQGEGPEGQLSLMKASVLKADGTPVGEELMDLPSPLFRVLAPLVMQVNGFGDDTDEEGNA